MNTRESSAGATSATVATTSPRGAPRPSGTPRLVSLDALRGFGMFWIVGGREAVVALLALAGLDGARSVVEHHTAHAPWHGFRAWDLVFPLFLFLAGMSTAFSFALRRERGAERGELALHALWRGLLLVLLGAIYNGLLSLDFANQRWASVLGRIGLAWMFAAWLYLSLAPRGRALAALALLVGYWAAMTWIPVPGFGAGDLTQGHNFADWFDQRCLPGRLHVGDHDPEGLFSTIPAIATALLGTLAGDWMRRTDLGPLVRVRVLVLAGLALLAVGHLAGLVFPINKRLWTSSFVLVCAGWSALLVAAFHVLFDLLSPQREPSRRHRRIGAFLAVPGAGLAVLGAHALLAYMAARFIDFQALARLALGRALERELLHEGWLPVLGLALLWLAVGAYAAAAARRRVRRPAALP
jgi:predicted acyltransferase